MKTKYFLIILLLLSLFVPLTPNTSSAQPPSSPIILWMDGDYYRYVPAADSLEQITTWGYNRRPVISPDNTRIAYSSTATVAVEAIERVGGIGGGDLPSNIWVLEIDSGDAFRAADQPPDASLFTEGQPDKFTLRSEPAWSPDSTKLAWTEQLTDGSNRLAIYTFSTGATAFTNIPEAPYGVPVAIPIKWGDSGIVAEVISTETQGLQNDYYVFNNDGSLRLVLQAPSIPDSVFYGDFELVDFGASEFLGLWRSDGIWTLLDPNGIQPVQSYQGPIEVYNPLAPNSVVGRVALGGGSYSSVIVTPTQSFPLGENSANYNSFSIAPGGNAIAYIDVPTNTPYYWQNGTLYEIPKAGSSISSLVWGYTELRVPGSGTVVSNITEPTVCDGFMVSRLSAGYPAIVVPGEANNVRANPGLDEPLVGSIPGGAQFNVLGGPTCADGSAWWRVAYEGITGWTAEGGGTEYWLRPGIKGSVAPDLPGAVLEITEAGSPVTAYAGVSRASEDLDELLWGDRVLWTGKRVNNETLPWLEVRLGSGTTAYVVETTGAFTVRNPGYQTPGLTVGATIRITPAGDRMNLRSDTSTSAGLIRALLQGNTATVIGGPVYNEYYVWWQLRLPSGETGWAVDVPGWFQLQ